MSVHSGRSKPVVRHQSKGINDYLREVHPGEQQHVLCELLRYPVNTLVCAGPGCGKSYIKQKAIDYYLANGYAVLELASIARVLHSSRQRPQHSAYRLDTLQGFTGENHNYLSSVPLPKFRKRVERKLHAVSPRVKGGAPAELILIFEEVFAITGPQINYAVACAKSMPTISGLAAIWGFGDPLQCECIGAPTGMSNFLKDPALRILALSESVRFSGKLREVVDDLRDCRKEVSSKTIRDLHTLCLQTRNRGAAAVELCATHARCEAGNKAAVRDYNHFVEISPVGGKKKDRRLSIIAVGAEVIIKRNMRLGPDEVWIPQGPDDDEHNALQNQKTFVANGDLATVVYYPYQTKTGMDSDGRPREFTRIDADDDKISFVRLQLENGSEIELSPTKTDGVLALNATLARCLTIHSQQGRTLTSGSINLIGSYNTRTLGLVALSRFRKWRQIWRLVLESGASEFRNGGPTNENHREWSVKVLEAEDAVRRRFAPAPCILEATLSNQVDDVVRGWDRHDIRRSGATPVRGVKPGPSQATPSRVHLRWVPGDTRKSVVGSNDRPSGSQVHGRGSE